MNILIIGGLVVVGLLAIVGVVALAMGTTRARAATTKRAVSTTSALNTSSASTVPMGQTATSPQDVSAQRDEGSYTLNRDDTQHVSSVEDTHLPVSNEQFQELTVQLRSLYNEITGLERRLILLTEIANHIERKNNERERMLLEDEHR
jgi:hypothetical protein